MPPELMTGALSGAPGLPPGLAGMNPLLQTGTGRPALRQAPLPDALMGEQLYDLLAQKDPKAIAKLRNVLKEVRQSSLEGREVLERGWWQKLLYINNRQWIYYSSRQGWQDKRFAKWIPRPVTNICAETVQSIRAMLAGIEPTLRVRPNGQEPVNIITAQIADDMEPIIAEEHRMQRRFFEADFWAPALGTVFLHPYWDRDDPTHTEFVQALECGECGTYAHPLDIDDGVVEGCPQCGAPAEAFKPAVDQSGGPVGREEPLGIGKTDVVSPLEILIPTYQQRWEDVDRLIRLRWRPESYYEGRPYKASIKFSTSASDRSLELYRSLALMTDLTTKPMQMGGAAPSRTKGCIEMELWIKPGSEYPEGLWCRAVGGQHGEALILHDHERGVIPGPLPYRDQRNKPLWPWMYYPYEEVGGRIWAKGALDSIIQKQDQINRNDSMVELIMQRMANPIWLEPKGAEVQRFTGEPGLIVRYQVVAGTNAKPERLEGASPGQAFFTLRTQYLTDAERLAGTQDVLKGMNPGGVEAFSALNLLVERSQSRFQSLFKARGRAYRDWFAVAIELERTYGPLQRTRAVLGTSGSWTFQQFRKQNLQGAITVVIEDGSETPKTSLGKRAAIQQAQALKVFNPEDPDVAYKTLEILGVPELAPSLDMQTKAAQAVQEQYEQWVNSGRAKGPNPLVVLPWQNHAIYLTQIDLWANGDRIRELVKSDKTAEMEITVYRMQHLVAQMNPFGLPVPTGPPGMAPGGPGAPGPSMGAPPGGPTPPNGPEGAGRAAMNSDQESGAVDTMPGAAPGGGNMAPPV